MSSSVLPRWMIAAATAVISIAGGAAVSFAQSKLDVHYTATLAGIPIGRGAWAVDIADDRYSGLATGRTLGIFRIFSGGIGTAAGSGALNAWQPAPARFTSEVKSEKKVNEIRMAISAGMVKEFSAEPPTPPDPDRVPITDAHRRGVLDPMSALLMGVAGTGSVVSSEACNRTLPVFDGRGRFDLVLSYKRMDEVKAQKGYHGPVVVCSVMFRPIAGHRPSRSAIKYLSETKDIELWLAPVVGTRILVPYRVSIPTIIGSAVLEATQFVTTSPATPASLKTQ